MLIESVAALRARQAELSELWAGLERRVLVCAGTGCVAGGALEVHAALTQATEESALDVSLELSSCADRDGPGGTLLVESGCHGFCELGPLVHILPDDILYTRVRPKDAAAIVEKTLGAGEVIDRLLYKDPVSKEPRQGHGEMGFYAHQKRVVLARCGEVSPASLDSYLATGGFCALATALDTLTPEEVLREVEQSGLRGRGGGGFSTGRKWRSALRAREARPDSRLHVICNGDEGDPGAFMDRSIMEGDPFAVLEGMALGAFALGSTRGYIYVRHEYPLAVRRLERAIAVLRDAGLLGERILGCDFSFDLELTRGGGAFVCGESSALMRSIEGKPGEPRAKYTHSTDRGLFDEPTVLNNVETWALVPYIVDHGAAHFAAIGTERSPGTKAFSLVGKVNNTGLVEVPMGTTLRRIIFEIGGGIQKGRAFKAVQTGGPSGGCLPAEKLDLPVDFDTLTAAGSMMGSGGMIVMDERTCMVDVAKYFIDFLMGESCGKCVPCREGLGQLSSLLAQVTRGEGSESLLSKVESLAETMELASLCALGRSAPNPVLSTLAYFRDEYLQHIEKQRCPAGVCKALVTYRITEACTGCEACRKACPVGAITGEKKVLHVIDDALCTRCGACEAVCAFDAVLVE